MKKLWGIRHIRYWYLLRRFNLWWSTVGHQLGAFPNQADIDYLDRVWEGKE